MPITINTTQQIFKGTMTHASLPRWLQQSLTRFLNNLKGSGGCPISQPKDTHDSCYTLTNASVDREHDSAEPVSPTVANSQLAYKKMLRSLENIRIKWATVTKVSHSESAELIMLATQSYLIGLPAKSKCDNPKYNRSIRVGNKCDRLNIIALREPNQVVHITSDRSVNKAHAITFLETGLSQLLMHPLPWKLGNRMQGTPHNHRNRARKKNYKFPNILYSPNLIKDSRRDFSLSRIWHNYYAIIEDRFSNLHRAFTRCLESVSLCSNQFTLFLECISFRYGDVILLLSRSTMRRVKFLYWKPPTTLSV